MGGQKWAIRGAKCLALAAGLLAVYGCDKEGAKQCAWVLEPEPKLKGTTDPGFIPMCARNRDSMKEDCRLQMSLEDAQAVYGRKFRYVDLRWASPGLPRTIVAKEMKYCDNK